MHSPRRGCEPERGSCTVAAERHRRRRGRGRGLPGPGHRGLLVAADRQRHEQLGPHPSGIVVMAISVVILGWFFLTSPASSPSCRASGSGSPSRPTASCATRSPATSSAAKDFKQFVPLLMTLFTLILFNNVMGVMPFIQFPSMSRIAFPIVLTLIVYVVYHTVAIRRKHGVLHYLKSLVPPGLPGWLRADHVRPRVPHLLLHPAADPRPATLRQHARRPPDAPRVHPRRRVPAAPRQQHLHPALGYPRPRPSASS